MKNLRQALERQGWSVVEREGDGYRICGSWHLRRSGSKTLILDFQGQNDMELRPLNQAFGVDVRGRAGVGLYFSRIGTRGSNRRGRWTKSLTEFVKNLER